VVKLLAAVVVMLM